MNQDEVELGHYGRILRRSWWMVALSVFAMVLLALFFLPAERNFYESRATVRLVPSLGDVGSLNDPIVEETEAIVAKSIGDQVVTGSEFDVTIDDWDENLLVTACLDTGAIVISNDCNTQILDFQYRANSAEKASYFVERSANLYLADRLLRAETIRDNTQAQLDLLLEDLDLRIQTEEAILERADPDSVDYTLAEIRLRRIEPERLDVRSQIQELTSTPLDVGSILGTISTPTADASGIARPIAILAGILMGLLLGGLAAVLTDRLDRRVSSPEETEFDLGVPVLGDIPRITEGSPALVTALNSDTQGAEAFRRLAAAALAPRNGYVVDSLAVTGATEGEGRTTTAVNLAIAIAQTGRKVLLVAADRRNEALDQLFGLSLQPGLSDFMRTGGDLEAARQAIDNAHDATNYGISVMASGAGGAATLSNNGLSALLKVAQERGMIVIFDTPPARTHADALQIAAVVDAVYIVAAVGRTRRSELAELRVQLLNVQADVAGSVFNRNSRLSLLPSGFGDVGSVSVPTGVPGNRVASRQNRSTVNDFGTSNVSRAPQASPQTASGLEVVEDAEIVAEVDDLEESA